MRWWSSEPGRARGRVAGQGSRVVVVGRLQRHSWTAEDGGARSTVEVMADELHHQVVGFVKQALYSHAAYEEVMRCLVEGWAGRCGHGGVGVAGRTGMCRAPRRWLRPASGWV